MTVLRPLLSIPVHDATQSKVCNLQSAVLADQQVGRLQVPVHDVVGVEVVHPPEQHHHVALDLGLGERGLRVLDQLRQVRHHELKHEDEAQTLGEHIVQSHHVLAVQLLQSSDLSDGGLADPVLQSLHWYLLQSHGLTRVLVSSLHHNTMSSLSNPPHHTVVVHPDTVHNVNNVYMVVLF